VATKTPQKFEHHNGKVLSTSSGIVEDMVTRLDLNLILANNLRFFMQRSKLYKNANALGVAAKVAPNTVRNLLDPKKRTVTAEKPEGFPNIDKLVPIAQALNCQVWELLHPDIELAMKQRAFYKQAGSAFKADEKERNKETNRS
jgi:hypothetical protein